MIRNLLTLFARNWEKPSRAPITCFSTLLQTLKQYPASGLLFAILDLFQRAKTSVHPVENSIVLLLSLITLNKRKVNNIHSESTLSR